jgi:hypothetical protein
MPKQPTIVRSTMRMKARLEPQAAEALEEPVLFSFIAVGGGQRGTTVGVIAPIVSGTLADLAVPGIGELVSHLTEAATEGVEGIAEATKKERSGQRHPYRGSKYIKVSYRRQYYLAASASKVGIFRPKGYFRLTRVEPIVIIPREAIKNVSFDSGFSGFLWSCCQMYPLGPWSRKLSVTFDDGGGLSFWLPRWGQLARLNVAGISAVFAHRERQAIAVGSPTVLAVDGNDPRPIQNAMK